jgi:hypothetical protein
MIERKPFNQALIVICNDIRIAPRLDSIVFNPKGFGTVGSDRCEHLII